MDARLHKQPIAEGLHASTIEERCGKQQARISLREAQLQNTRGECLPTAQRPFFCSAWPMRMWMDKCAMTISVAMLMRSPTIAFTNCV